MSWEPNETPDETEGILLQIRLSPKDQADLSLLAGAEDRTLEDYAAMVLEAHLYGKQPVLALMRAGHHQGT